MTILFKQRVLAHWRSTLAGLAMIVLALTRVHSLADLAQKDIQAQLFGGVGLIAAADAKPEEKEK